MTGRKIIHNERGFVLATVMSVLLLLVFIGIASMTRSTTEQLIAGNAKVRQVNFHETDGGIELGELLAEENLACAGGFTANNGSVADVPAGNPEGVRVDDLDFAWNPNSAILPTNTDYDLFFPRDLDPTNDPPGITYLNFGSVTRDVKGGALQMAAGYMGKGKSAASGGTYKLVTIFARRQGLLGSISELRSEWRHMTGQAGPCIY